MARILSQTLIRESQTLLIRDPSPSYLLSSFKSPLLPRLVNLRCARSNRPENAQLVEIDLGSESESGGAEVEVHLGMRRLEDAIHGIIVRRSAPDWLPFIPGSSYWVPPRNKRALGMVELVGRLANPLTEEETMSFTTIRGWPSSAYFVEGALPHPVKRSPKKVAAQSDDEE